MTQVTIDRELLERVLYLMDNYIGTTHPEEDELRAILAAPHQPEVDGLEVVAWQDAETPTYVTGERRQMHGWANDGYPIVELCRLSDATRTIAELRERLDVMTQCADNYSRMFEESAEECERLRTDNSSLRGSCKALGENNKHQARSVKKLERERDTLRQPEGDAHKNEAQPEVAQNTGSRSMTNKLSSQGCTGCTGVEGVAAPCETPDAVDIFAWATFDGEGSYDLRLYEDNEGYRDDFRDANPLLHPDWVFPLCRLSDAQRAIAELREECERLRVKLMTIASAEPGRHNIEWAKAMAATGNNEAYAKWREAFDQRDKLAGLLRRSAPHVMAIAGASHMMDGFKPRRNKLDELSDEIDAALAALVEVKS